MKDINNNVNTNNESLNPVVENNPISPTTEIQPPKQNSTFKILFFITILIVIGLVIVIFFLLKNPKETAFNITENQTIEQLSALTSDKEIVPTTNFKINTLYISDIQMEIPETWKVFSVYQNEAKILTDYPNYKVYLTLKLNINDSTANSSYKSASTKIKTNYGEVFNVQGGGPIGWTGALINENKYSLVWTIESNQPVPKNLDGIWIPDNNLTQEIFLDITKTIKISTLEKELSQVINPKNDSNIIWNIQKTSGTFAHLTVGGIGGGAHCLYEKENGVWNKLHCTQDSFECEVVINKKVLPELVDNSCYYYETKHEGWKYNTISNQWEKD